ncbi:MAG: MmgE/PrpD family protein [Rhodospirillales bacterium]
MPTFDVRACKPGETPAKEDQLAWKLAEMALADWPEDAAINDMVVNRVIDSYAVAMAAINRQPVANARSQAVAHPRAGGATVFGLPKEQRFACEWGAWANSCAVRELDFNDAFMATESSHPSDNIATLVAVAQQMKRSGADLIRAVATAYQVQCDLCMAMELNTHGIDHTAYLGPAITSGIGAMLKLDIEVLYQALQHAVHVTQTTRQGRKGTMSSWKAYAPGHVGKLCIDAIDRAMRGEKGPSPVYEGDFGVIPMFLDGPDGHYTVTLPDPGQPHGAILNTYPKEYSVGYHGQPIIDLAFRFRKKINNPEDIESVDIFSKRSTHLVMGSGSNDPQKYDPNTTRETLDHCAMYAFAVAFFDGTWHHEKSYLMETRTRPEVLSLWRKTKTHEDEEWNRRYREPPALEKDQGSRIEITFKNGEKMIDELAVADSHPRGARPMKRSDYVSKFNTLTEGIATSGEARRFLGVAERLAKLAAADLLDLNVVADATVLKCAEADDRGIY